jgi:hypothetical protein
MTFSPSNPVPPALPRPGQPGWDGRMNGQSTTPTLDRIPVALRLVGVVCGCLLLLTATVYVLGAVAVRLASPAR